MSCSTLSIFGIIGRGSAPWRRSHSSGYMACRVLIESAVTHEGGCVVKQGHLTAVCLAVVGMFSIWVTPAFAYLGPGVGLSAIGTFLALIMGVILAFVGFIWYPVRRLLRKGNTAGASPSEPRQKRHAESGEAGA
jgi:hypothetical protein